MKKIYQIRLISALLIFLSMISLIFGFSILKISDVQFGVLLQRVIYDFSISAVIILFAVIILTFLFGRFYCSLICPLGILQEIFALIIKKKKCAKSKNYFYKYFISAFAFGALVSGSALIIRYIDPYTILTGAFVLGIYALIALFTVLALVFFKNRFFCSNICPIGAILGLISKVSLFKIYIDDSCVSCSKCEKNCPVSSINLKEKTVDNETCVKCLKCISGCPKNAIKFGIKKNEIKFSPKRREILISTGVILLFSSALKLGSFLKDNVISKLKNVILPPGAVDENRMINKCFNCNLCINNCPNKILQKADSEFGAIHIDYKKGKGYCEYNCNECSKICPSGAIKRIGLEQKQKTRIAMAIINEDKCKNCSICTSICPKGAILKLNNKIIIDSKNCIGCAKCKSNCPSDAISVYSVNEQKLI